MCSIIGYCGLVTDPKAFTEGFAATVSRGPDDTKIIDTGRGLLGFHRLAIMDLTSGGMQPFTLQGDAVVCNGELYGFAEERALLMKKGYHFTSDSDCEILLPMLSWVVRMMVLGLLLPFLVVEVVVLLVLPQLLPLVPHKWLLGRFLQ